MIRWPFRVRPAAYALLAIAYAGAIFALSALPAKSLPDGGFAVCYLFNLLHAPLFGGLGLLTALALAGRRDPRVVFGWKQVVLVVTICLGYAVLDEWHQSFTHGRSPDPVDLVTDLAGILSACLVVRWLAQASATGAGVVSAALLAMIAAGAAWVAAY